jgi:hypothetical protein
MTWFIGGAIALLLVALAFGRTLGADSSFGAGIFVAPFCVALVVWGLALNVPDPGACQTGEQRGRFVPPTSALLSQELKLRDARDTQIALGNSPGPARTTIGLDTGALTGAPGDSRVALSIDSFRRGDNPQVIAAVHAYADFTAAQRITVFVCVERGSDTQPSSFSLDPGIYTGVLSITDPRLPTTAVPFTVTLAYPNQFWPLLPWCAVLLVGAAYLAVIRRTRSGDEEDRELGFKSIVDFLGEPLGIAATIAGGGAAIGVYVSSCLANPTWATSTSDWLSLTAGMFGAFVAAGTAFRFANSLDPRSARDRKDALEANPSHDGVSARPRRDEFTWSRTPRDGGENHPSDG